MRHGAPACRGCQGVLSCPAQVGKASELGWKQRTDKKRPTNPVQPKHIREGRQKVLDLLVRRSRFQVPSSSCWVTRCESSVLQLPKCDNCFVSVMLKDDGIKARSCATQEKRENAFSAVGQNQLTTEITEQMERLERRFKSWKGNTRVRLRLPQQLWLLLHIACMQGGNERGRMLQWNHSPSHVICLGPRPTLCPGVPWNHENRPVPGASMRLNGASISVRLCLLHIPLCCEPNAYILECICPSGVLCMVSHLRTTSTGNLSQ